MEQTSIADAVTATIALFKNQYKGAIVRAAICNDDELKLHCATIEFTNNKNDDDKIMDYGNLILVQQITEVDEVIKKITRLAEEKIFDVDNVGDLPAEGSFQKVEFVPSKNRYGFLFHDYPRRHTTYSLTKSIMLPRDPLIFPNLPLYPDGNKAVLDFMDIRTNIPQSEIYIQIPDFRAKIENLTISGREVIIDIVSNLPDKDLILKLYADYEKPTQFGSEFEYAMKSPDIDIQDGKVQYNFEKEFDYILVSLSHKNTGQVIDYRGFNFNWGLHEGVIIDREKLDIKEIIRRGEDIKTEFKRELSEQEFLETVVSFSNTVGGIILLGVNDNCQITSFEPKTQDQIPNLISSNIDPRPKFEFYSRTIDEKIITIVEIPVGENRPYVHREKGFYIRSGSNDRHPTRSEMDAFYEKKRNDYRLAGFNVGF